MNLIAADHVFHPRLPVPHNEVGEAGSARSGVYRNCECESGTGGLDLYIVG